MNKNLTVPSKFRVDVESTRDQRLAPQEVGNLWSRSNSKSGIVSRSALSNPTRTCFDQVSMSSTSELALILTISTWVSIGRPCLPVL